MDTIIDIIEKIMDDTAIPLIAPSADDNIKYDCMHNCGRF